RRQVHRECMSQSDQLVLHGVLHQLRQRVHFQLLHQARLVGADGLARQRQLLGDVVDVGALGQALEHRKLALRQQRVQRPRLGQAHFEHHAVSQRRVDVTPATRHPTDRGQQQRRITVLGGITCRSGLQRPRRHLCLVVHRQHQDRRGIVQRTYPRDRLQAIHTRHGDIQQYHLTRRVA
ncbi:enolase (ISS), partial [Corchorus olitorius]